MLADARPVQQVPAGQLAREPDPDPAAGDGGLRQALRHQVVERPVEMRQRHIHQHAGDR